MQIYLLGGSWLTHLLGRTSLEVFLNLFLILALLTLTIYWLLELLSYLDYLKQSRIFLEVTPPARVSKSEAANQQLLEVLMSVASVRSSRDKVLHKKFVLSFEIVANTRGIRFVINLPKSYKRQVKQALLAYLPELQIKEVKDYLPEASASLKVTSFKSNDQLKETTKLRDDDPLAYVLGSMTSLKAKELLALQLVVADRSNREPFSVISRIAKLALSGKLQHSMKDEDTDKLMSVDIRTLALAKDAKAVGLNSALASFNLIKKQTFNSVSSFQFRRRAPSLFSANHLSSSLIASLYHFPGKTLKTDGLIKSRTKLLPLPPKLRGSKKFDVLLGQNNYHEATSKFGLNESERRKHMYVLGATGSGKSTLFKYMIAQDIKSGKGLAVIDPHGDLAESLLDLVPKSRQKDLVYINPSDISQSMSLNLLEIDPSLKGDARLLEQDYLTEQVVSIFRKLFSGDSSGGHRLEYILRNGVQTAFYVPGSTIFTVYKLLIDSKYRDSVVSKLRDKTLKAFWEQEYGQAGSMQRVKLSVGITSKLNRFLRSTATRRMLGQPKSSLDFDDLIQNKKIVIANLSKGTIGEDTSSLVGMILLAKFQSAAYKRVKLKETERTPFYLYVDEFQDYANSSFLSLISESRKYGFNLCLAEQSPSQQLDPRSTSVLLANVGTLVCFRLSSPIDESLLLPLFEPDLAKGDLLNLDTHNFYVRIAADEVNPPTSGRTLQV